MEAQTQEALSPKVTRQDILNLIPQYQIKSMLRRHHLKRELIIGLVGNRGDGKSGSGASMALIDWAFEGTQIWSNMNIKADIEIEDKTAQQYGLNHGGVAHYESKNLDAEAFLKGDLQFKDSLVLIDEINMEFSDSRRFMSNTNLFFNRMGQQLRKFQTSMVYTVINEMFVDSRLRDLTDVFIKCEDTALSVEGLNSHKPTGQDFKWTIYPMSGYLVGREMSYPVTKKALPPVYFHFERWRGIYNDKQMQAMGKMKYGVQFTDEKGGRSISGIETEQSPELKRKIRDYAWLEAIAMAMMEDGRKFIPQDEVVTLPEVREHGVRANELSSLLKSMFNIWSTVKSIDGTRMTVYEVPDDTTTTNVASRKRDLVLV